MCLLLCGCSDITRHECRFETIDNVFLCVDNQFAEEYNHFTGEYTQKDASPTERIMMDSYDCCINQLPYPVNLVEKENDGAKICYDKNNKIELPILYCQKDHNVFVNVDTNLNVKQTTNVSQTSVMKNNTYF